MTGRYPDQLSDCRLAQQAQTGSASAVETLLRKYYPLIRSHAKDYSAPGEERDDLVIEAKLGAWEAIMLFDPSKDRPLSSLITTISKRRIFTFLKTANRKYNAVLNDSIRFDPDGFTGTLDQEICTVALPNNDNPADVAISRLEHSELVRFMKQSLSRMECEVLLARADGLRYGEIAIQINTTAKKVDNAIARAKKKIETLYE